MNLEQFSQQRRASWRELEELLQRSERNPRGLSPAELDALGALYRNTSADLALAQREFPNQRVTTYLNHLVGRAHALIYRGEPLRRRGLRTFFASTFPQLYRGLLPYTILATILFGVATLSAYLLVWLDPSVIYVIAGAEIAPLVREVEAGRLWTEIEPTVRSAASAFILTNNIQVTFLTFAGGITAGVLSAWVMIVNGLNIGAIFGLLQAHGMSRGLAEFVSAHGFIELSVIFVAGGCGLYMGDGLLRPGLHKRRAILIQRSRECIQIILGCAPLLVLAGLIEGFISPSGLPWIVKLAVGLSTGAALHWYWLTAGKRSWRSDPMPTANLLP
jgi:uncharacterized membrane protein SpoIIM required for sporulation